MTNSTELWVIAAHVTYDVERRYGRDDDAVASRMQRLIRLFSYTTHSGARAANANLRVRHSRTTNRLAFG